jgi:O-antigen/teichoic acid export membrane protein
MKLLSAETYKKSLLGRSENFIKYFKNTFWLLFEKVFVLGFAFIVGIFVARYLGPHELGLLDYARSIAVFFISFASLNVEQFLVKDLVEGKRKEETYMGTYLVLRIAGSLISLAFLCFLYLLGLFDDNLTFYLVILIASSSVFSSFDVLKSYYQSKLRSQKIVIASLLQIAVSTILKIYFIAFEYSILFFALVYLLETIAMAIGLIYAYGKDNKGIRSWTYDHGIAKEILMKCWPMVISGLLIIIYMRVDQIMLKWLLNTESVGLYSAAVRLSELWIFIGVAISSSYFPALIEAKSIDSKLYFHRLQNLLTLVVLIALLIIIPVSLFSSQIVVFLYGNIYAPSGNVLSIHAWSLLFIFMGQVGSRWLINESLQKLNLIRTVGGLVINVVLNLIFIPKFGIEGAAFTTLVSQLYASYLGNLFNRNSRQLFVVQTKALFLYQVLKLNFNK